MLHRKGHDSRGALLHKLRPHTEGEELAEVIAERPAGTDRVAGAAVAVVGG